MDTKMPTSAPNSQRTKNRLARLDKMREHQKREQADLTERQREVFEFIKAHIEKHGYPPTRTEIAYVFKFASPNAAHGHVVALVSKGYVSLSKLARGITLAK